MIVCYIIQIHVIEKVLKLVCVCTCITIVHDLKWNFNIEQMFIHNICEEVLVKLSQVYNLVIISWYNNF